MKVLRFFILTMVVLASNAAKSQALINPAIEETLNRFITYSNQQDWDKAFDLLYPKLFTKVPKQDLLDIMKSTEADGMNLQMANTRITSTSVPVTEGDETFVRVQYVSDLTVTIQQGGKYDYPKSIQAMDEQFKIIYGTNNVKWDDAAKQYKIVANKSMMAIQAKQGDWKLVEVNMDQPELMESLFPASVMETLVRVD